MATFIGLIMNSKCQQTLDKIRNIYLYQTKYKGKEQEKLKQTGEE